MPTAKASPISKATALAIMVDEIGDLEKELNPLKPKTKRLNNLRTDLRLWYELKPAAESFSAEGTRYVAEVGECADENSVDIAALFRLIGPKRFLAIASVTLAAAKEALKPEEFEKIRVHFRYSGPRSIKITEKGIAV